VFFAALVRFNFAHSYAIIKAYLWLIFHPRMIMGKRKEVQALRIVPDDQIMPILYQKSVVADYFLKGTKTFSGLKYSPKFRTTQYEKEII
jgi:hypothetical protein